MNNRRPENILRSVTNGVQSFWTGMLDFLYPPHCVLCQSWENLTDAGWLCLQCVGKFTLLKKPLCLRCGREAASDKRTGKGCADCVKQTFHHERAVAAGKYEDLLRDAILAFKYGGKAALAEDLADLIAPVFDEMSREKKYDGIIPVPLYSTKKIERGFNQAELIARELSKKCGVPVNDALIRVRNVVPQASLAKGKRLANVRDAFEVFAPKNVQGKNLLLLDDVMTTCSTVSECARMLKSSGAASVDVLTVAR